MEANCLLTRKGEKCHDSIQLRNHRADHPRTAHPAKPVPGGAVRPGGGGPQPPGHDRGGKQERQHGHALAHCRRSGPAAQRADPHGGGRNLLNRKRPVPERFFRHRLWL